MAGSGLQRRQRSASAAARRIGRSVPWLSLIPWLLNLGLPPAPAGAEPPASCRPPGTRGFDLIVYGDEPAGLLTALALAAQRPGPSGHPARVAVVREEAQAEPLGGTITRSGLAYLDRNQLPWDQWIWRGNRLAPSSRLYGQFLKLSGTRGIATDPGRSDRGFRAALEHHGVVILSAVGLTGVNRSGRRICGLTTLHHGELPARYVIDNSLGADLAHRSGVAFSQGMGRGTLAGESLALGWIFELRGLSLERFRSLERRFTQRLLDPNDLEAQNWLQAWPAYRRNPEVLRRALLDPLQQPRVAISWTEDSADQVSPALAIAFHGESGIPPGLVASPIRLDLANIALLQDRLSVNALLLRNNATQNRRVLAGGGRPLPWMLPYKRAVTTFFLRHGATAVHWSPRLYVRVADQIRRPHQTLSATVMAAGGTTPRHSVGTFTYGLDIRGGLRQRLKLPHQPVTFNVGYRHTLPQEFDNLAVLGPAGGFGGLGVGAGRIVELNVTVGQGLACAIALALDRDLSLSAIDPAAVHRALDWEYVPYGRPLHDDLPGALSRWWQQATTTLRWRAASGRGSALAPAATNRRCDGIDLKPASP